MVEHFSNDLRPRLCAWSNDGPGYIHILLDSMMSINLSAKYEASQYSSLSSQFEFQFPRRHLNTLANEVESILRSREILWTTTLWKVMCAATAQGEDGPGQPATRNGMQCSICPKITISLFHMKNGGAPYAIGC